MTYWHQLSLVHELNPVNVMEVGVGTGLVAAYLRSNGVDVTTLDINPRLEPDHVGSILYPPEALDTSSFDLVLCSRVLHHIDFDDFDRALYNLWRLTRRHCLITLPVNDFRIYLMSRVTSSSLSTISIPLPLSFKSAILHWQGRSGRGGSGLWQIDSSAETSEQNVVRSIKGYFNIIKQFRIPEDQSHLVFSLEKAGA